MSFHAKFRNPFSGAGRTAGPCDRKPAWRRIFSNRAGAAALLFGLTLLPIMGFVGGAIDYANAYRMRSKLQSALDTAALAAGRTFDMGSSEGEALDAADKVLQANLGENFPAYSANISIDTDAGSVIATADMQVDTYVLGVLGHDYFPVAVTSTVRLPNGKVEVAMVLDNSGSMGGSRLRDLKDAATRLTEILFQNNRTQEGVKIGLVPFAAAVKVGTRYANAPWMDTTGQSSIHFENFDDSVTRFALFNTMRNTSWSGCVEVRPSPHDVTDSAPVGGDSLFVPMFAPDEPDDSDDASYNNSYLDDDGGDCRRSRGGESEEQAQEKTCKYDRERPDGGIGPNYMCDPEPILALSGEEDTVTRAIDDMRAQGMTNIMEGIMWGWRVLSPQAPFTEGRAYDDSDNRKFMIVMTDGANTHTGRSNQNMSRYSAFGYSKHGRLRSPTTSTNRLVDAMNAKTLQGCTNSKSAGITVFTIAFNVNDEDTVTLLRQCASGASRAFTIDNGDALIAVFEAIAGEINKLRISS